MQKEQQLIERLEENHALHKKNNSEESDLLFFHLLCAAFNLATKAINGGLNNKRIFTEIDRINSKVDQLVFSIAQMDIDLATKFRNNSIGIAVSCYNITL